MKLNDLPVTLAVAGCITAAALTAMTAQAHGPDFPIDLDEVQAEAQAAFSDADADGNGTVSVAEFEATDLRRDGRRRNREDRRFGGRDLQGGVFAEADADGDGQLSEAEFDAVPEAVRRLAQRRLFSHLDADGDSLLSESEFPSPYRRLAALDANGDGEITRDEMGRERRERGRRGRR